jgi:2'-5' RNA ligase
MDKKYLIIAYPTFTGADLTWIEAIRANYDPQAALVAPHLTLLFPIAADAVSVDEVVTHLHNVVTERVCPMPAFVVTFRSALVMPETGRAGGHLFLIPDEGMSQLVKLHDWLYRGPLASHLRLDIPFMPHITIGAGHDLAALHQVAQTLNDSAFALETTIDRLTVIRHAAGVVTTVGEIPLADPAVRKGRTHAGHQDL